MRSLIGHLPIFGGLVGSRVEDHIEAVKEILTAAPFSLAPIWIAALGLLLKNWPTSLAASFSSILQQGELLIYSTSALGPIFYVILKKRRHSDASFPGALGHIVMVVVLMLFCSICFALLRAYPRVAAELDGSILIGSAIVYFLSLVLLYLATVYDRSLSVDPREEMKAAEAGFTREFGKHRG